LVLDVATPPFRDKSHISLFRLVLGDAEKVIIDANGYWSQHEAVRVIGQLADADIYIEQPCATLEECAAVRKRSALPFVLDECIGGYGDILRAVQIDAMDAVMMKLSRHGGITPIRRARDLCVQSGIAMTIEESGGGDIVSAAMAQLAATVPEGLLVNAFLVGRMVKERLATDWSPLMGGGDGVLPPGPGLGITIDETRLGAPALTLTSE
jgi:cis-L-3-hydroxyproline dehydratase